MTKLLIAVASCQRDRVLHDKVRDKWASLLDQADIRFFIGSQMGQSSLGIQNGENVYLPVPDGYFDLPIKVKAICQWALDWGYQYLFKTDVDVVPFERRFREFDFTKYDYAGSCRTRPNYPPNYCSGFGYFLSRKAMEIVVKTEIGDEHAEDRFVGDALRPSILSGEIKQHDIKWMVCAGAAGAGEPHPPASVPISVNLDCIKCQAGVNGFKVLLKAPGHEPKIKSCATQKEAEYLIRSGLASPVNAD
jgi:hypothetical protein